MPEFVVSDLFGIGCSTSISRFENDGNAAQLGVMKQKTLLESSFRSRKPQARKEKRFKASERDPVQLRSSKRLQGVVPEHEGVQEDPLIERGWFVLPNVNAEKPVAMLPPRRSNGGGRGSVYDQKVGICCHFCRQKKLCGEEGCTRCETRDDSLPCIGKSECSRCQSPTGRFCRACLLIRYGQELEDVRQDPSWLCPHCHEEESPDDGWICNSSICMTRRGLAPTGIAIFEAQKRGFLSVAHYLQARLIKFGQGQRAAEEDPPKQEITLVDATRAIPKKRRPTEVERLHPGAPVQWTDSSHGRVLRSAST